MTKRLSAILRLALVSLSLILHITNVYADDYPIYNDRGGNLEKYWDIFEGVKATGKRVVVYGKCMSACTLVLTVVPRDRICVKEGAEFVFHAAVDPDTKILNRKGTELWFRSMAADVQEWVSKHNAFTDLKPHVLRGSELEAMVNRC